MNDALFRRRPARRRQAGTAITETLLIAGFAGVALAAIPAIADYGTARLQTLSAARLLAWQRNVWLPGETAIELKETTHGAAGAISKADAEVTRDLSRHVFRDRQLPSASIHAEALAEFSPEVVPLDPRTLAVTATTSAAPLPVTLEAGHLVAGLAREAQSVLGSNAATMSLSRFNFVTSGFLKNEVSVTRTRPGFTLLPSVQMNEQVTMLTEAWNAGGTNREESKIQGLVPTKVLDVVYWQQFRAPLGQLANTIKHVYPRFDINKLLFGLTPGDAMERPPLDRFERIRTPANGGFDAPAGEIGPHSAPIRAEIDHFKYYRAFPPTPVLAHLP